MKSSCSLDDELQKRIEQGQAVSYSTLCLFTRLPFSFRIPIPFTRWALEFGHDAIRSLRRNVRRKPDSADRHITLAACLLSQRPVLRAGAEEAAKELRTALRLLTTGPATPEYDMQEVAMVHLFLGDALRELGRLPEARIHWQQAVELDPVRPPYGFSGPALEQLKQHPGNPSDDAA